MGNKKMIFFLFMGLFFAHTAARAQFNTILPAKKVAENHAAEATTGAGPSVNATDTVSTMDDIGEEAPELVEGATIDAAGISESKRMALAQFLTLPLDTIIITSRYGKRMPPVEGATSDHKGIDLDGNRSCVYSVMAGTVKKTGKSRSLGNYIIIQHGDFLSIYGHLSSVLVCNKQFVTAGQPIGITGSTGISSGDHLHFALKYKNAFIDPEPLICLGMNFEQRHSELVSEYDQEL